MSPEAVAFIETGKPATPRPAPKERVQAASTGAEVARVRPLRDVHDAPEPDEEDETEHLSVNDADDSDEEQLQTRRPSRRSRRKGREVLDPAQAEMLVPLTTRIQKSTSQALTRAYLEMKLRGEKPATQQSIVEEALRMWLANRQYL